MIKQQLKELAEWMITSQGLSRYQLSKELGLSRQAVNLWFVKETDRLRDDLPADKVILILEKLSVHKDYEFLIFDTHRRFSITLYS